MYIIYGINTDEYQPSLIERLGVFKRITRFTESPTYYELCKLTYPDPVAPTKMNCFILQWLQIEILPGTTDLVNQSIDAMLNIRKISKIVNYDEVKQVFNREQ